MKPLTQLARVSKEQIIKDLKKIGLEKGDHVAVTLSLKSIGYLENGPEEFIGAILVVIGPNGTLMMNTFTKYFPVSSIPKELVFDKKLTPTYTGIVPETLRKKKGSKRSKHPHYSITAFGKKAGYLTQDHDAKADPLLPYSRLAEIGGKYLCIGIGDRLVGICHVPQYKAGLSKIVPLYFGVKYRIDNKSVEVFVMKSLGCVDQLWELVPTLKRAKILKVGRIGRAQAYLGSAKEIIETMTEILKDKPQLILCPNVRCIWCRELERRMNLFNRIEKPRFFQKNNSIIKIIAIANQVRLKRFNLLIFRKKKTKLTDNKNKSFLHKIVEYMDYLCLISFLVIYQLIFLRRTGASAQNT